ncbi:MAG: hypothetical protein GX620_10170, partial [Chloroflexi bacterium]|nr:hypothetical protein [Chloroflexota bacterium]
MRQTITPDTNTSGDNPLKFGDMGRVDSPSARMWRRFRRHKLMYVGVFFIALFSLMAILAPLVSFGHDPTKTNLRERNQPPSTQHLLGTDEVGRDTWARLVYGAQIS